MSEAKDVSGGMRPYPSWPALKLDNHERADHSSGTPLPVTFDDPEWWRGWTIGRLGLLPEDVKAIFTLQAERRREEHVVALEAELNKAEAEATIARGRHERAANAATKVEDAFSAVEKDRLNNPTAYSWPLGVFYCIVALILWIADLPLSLLAADGLGIRTDYRALEDLATIRDRWTTMWEPLAFAIGIAALALFFKFVADFFFKPNYLSRPWVRLVATVLLMAVLLIVGGNLFLLARLRTGVRALQDMNLQAADGTASSAELQQQRKKMQDEANLSFVLLTLTLPLIGGVCASAGWSRLQNARRYTALDRERRILREVADQAAQSDSRTAAEFKKFQRAVAGAEQSSTQAATAAFTLYMDGYRQGFAVPETIHSGRQMHERVLFVLKQWLGFAQQHQARVHHSLAPPTRNDA